MSGKIYILIFALTVFSILSSAKVVSAEASTQTVMIVDLNKTITLNASDLQAFSGIAITNVTWDFADDTYGEGIVVSHTYIYDGVYNVVVSAKGDNGRTVTADLPIIVGGSVPFVPSQATYVGIYFANKPAGVYHLAVLQSNDSGISTNGFQSIGKFFNITSDLPNGSFNSTLIFSYDDVDDDGTVDGIGIKENTINLYYYNGASWTLVPNSVRDTYANTLTATVDHFTVFALLSPVSASTPPQSGSGQSSGGGGGGGTGSSSAQNSTTQQKNQTSNQTNVSAGAITQETGNATNEGSNAQENNAPTRTFLGLNIIYWVLIIALVAVAASVTVFLLRKKGLKSGKHSKKKRYSYRMRAR